MNKISWKGNNSWMFSNAITNYNANPNPDFANNLIHQMTEVVPKEDDPTRYTFKEVKSSQATGTKLNEGLRDIFNNQFTVDGRLINDKLEASGNTGIGDKDLTNDLKTFWYISRRPLPEVIKNTPKT